MVLEDRCVSKWTLIMIVTGIVMFASMFLDAIGVTFLGELHQISGFDLLRGGFEIGFIEIGTDSLSILHIFPAIVGIIGAAIVIISIITTCLGFNNRRFMMVVSLSLTVTLLLQVIFLLGGASIEIFTGSAKDLLQGTGATVTSMYGTYVAIFSTFICGMASTYRIREC